MRDFKTVPTLETESDVVEFFRYLFVVEDCSFHPDERFWVDDACGYINFETGAACFTEKTARHYDSLMSDAFNVCDNVYKTGLAIMVELGMITKEES